MYQSELKFAFGVGSNILLKIIYIYDYLKKIAKKGQSLPVYLNGRGTFSFPKPSDTSRDSNMMLKLVVLVS